MGKPDFIKKITTFVLKKSCSEGESSTTKLPNLNSKGKNNSVGKMGKTLKFHQRYTSG